MPTESMPDPVVAALNEFARSGEEAAFRLVVDRVGGLVFSSALRRTGDVGMAEEISQNVFAILARKARRVANHPSPEAWLFTTTRLESAMAMRKRQQHQRKLEALAAAVGTFDASIDPDAEAWKEALPQLCDSLDSLSQSHREILLARYYSDNSFSEIAQRFGKSEAACKMRVKRSLERLNAWMSRRGVRLSLGALAGGLSSEWAKAAPAALQSALPGTAIAAVSKLSVGKIFSNSVGTMGRMPKVGLLTASAAVVVGVCLLQSRPSNADTRPVALLKATSEMRIVKLRSALLLEPRADRLPKRAVEDPAPNPVIAVEEELAKFWLPGVELGGVSAESALDQIREQFQSLGGNRAVIFEYALAEGAESFPVDASLGNVTVLQALRDISDVAGVALDLSGNKVAMLEHPEAGAETATQRFRVPPDFLSSRGVTDPKLLFPRCPDSAVLEYLRATSELIVTGDARIRARAGAMAISSATTPTSV